MIVPFLLRSSMKFPFWLTSFVESTPGWSYIGELSWPDSYRAFCIACMQPVFVSAVSHENAAFPEFPPPLRLNCDVEDPSAMSPSGARVPGPAQAAQLPRVSLGAQAGNYIFVGTSGAAVTK